MKILAVTILLCLFSLPAFADETFDRVIESGEIKCGYFVWPPYFMIDPNTEEKSGIFHDYTEELGKRLYLKINWVGEMNFGTFLQDIANGRYDAECTGGWPNAERGKQAIYSKSIYYIPIVPFVRAGDKRFGSKSNINSKDITVSVIDGENGQNIRELMFPKAKEFALPQSGTGVEMLMNVVNKKADVAFTDIYLGQAFMKKNPDTLEPLFTDKPLQLFPQNFTLAPDAFRFREMLNVATDELIYTGIIDQILEKYEKDGQTSFYRLSKPYEIP